MAELTRRYVVMTMASEAPFDPLDPEGVFVLKPWKDPAALRALMTYRNNCYPELSRDLDAWIRVIEAGTAIRGDVGRRNEPHVKASAPTTRNGRPARVARPRARAVARKSRTPRVAEPRARRSARRRKKRSR